MPDPKFSFFLIVAALFTTAGCSDSPKITEAQKKTAALYGDEYIPVEIRTYDPPLRLKNLELQSQHEVPEWLKVERITKRPWAHSFDTYKAAFAKGSSIHQIENAREKFEQYLAEKSESLQEDAQRFIVLSEVVQSLHYTFGGREMMTLSILTREYTNRTTSETRKSNGRSLQLYTREDGQWKVASQQQLGPHFALFQEPEVQREFLTHDPDAPPEGPLSWQRRKLIAGVRPFQDKLKTSFVFQNISDNDVQLSLEPIETEKVIAANVTPSILPAGEFGSLEVTFDTNWRVDERFTFTLEVNQQEQDVAVMLQARKDFSINGQKRYSTKVSGSSRLAIGTSYLIENAKIDIVEKPSGLSVRLIPDDSGILWDIELEQVGEATAGEVRFRLTAEEGTAEAILVVEESWQASET